MNRRPVFGVVLSGVVSGLVTYIVATGFNSGPLSETANVFGLWPVVYGSMIAAGTIYAVVRDLPVRIGSAIFLAVVAISIGLLTPELSIGGHLATGAFWLTGIAFLSAWVAGVILDTRWSA
jgi:hypothetical protein